MNTNRTRAERTQRAADNSTPPGDLAVLAEDLSWRVRMECAGNPATPQASLAALADDPHQRVRTRLAANPSLGSEGLVTLARDSYAPIRRRVAIHPNATVEAFWILAPDPALQKLIATRLAAFGPDAFQTVDFAGHSSPAFRRAAAQSPLATRDLLAQLALDSDREVRLLVAGRPDTTTAVAELLARDDDSEVRSTVAGRPDLSTESLSRLARDPVAGVLIAAAANPSTPGPDLTRLCAAGTHDPALRRALAANPSLPEKDLQRLAHPKERWDVHALVLQNPNCPLGVFDKVILKTSCWSVNAAAAASPTTPVPWLRKFMLMDPRVQFALAGNPALPKDVLDHLLIRVVDGYVRGKAAANPAATPEMLRRLAAGFQQPAWILRNVARNPSCPDDLRDELLTWIAVGGAGDSNAAFDPDTCVDHPGDPKLNAYQWYLSQVPRDLAGRGDASTLWRVRHMTVTTAPRIPFVLLERCARDPRPEIRLRAASFDSVRLPVLQELAGDAYPNVANTAQRSIERAKAKPKQRTVRTPLVKRTFAVSAAVFAIVVLVSILTNSKSSDRSDPLLTSVAKGVNAAVLSSVRMVPTPFPAPAIDPVSVDLAGGARLSVAGNLGDERDFVKFQSGKDAVSVELSAALDNSSEIKPFDTIELRPHQTLTYRVTPSLEGPGAIVVIDGVAAANGTTLLPIVLYADSTSGTSSREASLSLTAAFSDVLPTEGP